jgi:hypothetical protein
MAANDNKGLFYAPSPPPQGNDMVALRAWCTREFDRIASNMREGRSARPPLCRPGLLLLGRRHRLGLRGRTLRVSQ